MTTVTDDHRARAEAALRPAGLHLRMSHEMTEQTERVAQAIADAEQRGPAGGRTDPTDAEENAYCQGLAEGFIKAVETVRATGGRVDSAVHTVNITTTARDHGVTIP